MNGYKCIVFALMCVFSLQIWAEEEETAPAEQPKFYRMYPDFVTNLAYGHGAEEAYLQIRVEMMTKDDAGKKQIEEHEAYLRNLLIDLFNTTPRSKMRSVNGRKDVRQTALQAVQAAMEKLTGETVIEDVLFTKIIVE